MTHGDAREGNWRGNWWMEWVASTLHTTSEHGVSSITTADAHTSVASSRLNWRPPADLNGFVRFAERRNLVSARVPSHLNWPLPSKMSNNISWNRNHIYVNNSLKVGFMKATSTTPNWVIRISDGSWTAKVIIWTYKTEIRKGTGI